MDRLLADARRALQQLEEIGGPPHRPDLASFIDREGRDAEPVRSEAREPRSPVEQRAPFPPSRGGLAGLLSSRAALRRAFLLSEIGGSPKGPRARDRS